MHPMNSWAAYLRSIAVPRQLIDEFVSGRGWARFDPELGYTLQDSAIRWGADGAQTVETFDDSGSRATLRFRGGATRITSYGEEFVEGIRLDDGETWQSYLAAHLREPVANFGVGGYGVYQAYRRLLRAEGADHGGDLVIMHVLRAGVLRSTTRSHWTALAGHRWSRFANGLPIFHGNCWPNIELDLDTGRFVERENPLRTTDSLYLMCDPDWLAEHGRDDLGSWLSAYGRGFVDELDHERVGRLAELLGTRFDRAAPDPRAEAYRIGYRYGQAAAAEVLDRTAAFTSARGKKLLVVLNLTAHVPALTTPPARADQLLRDHLDERGFAVFDMNEVYRREHATTTLAFDDYLGQYLMTDASGVTHHYNARGCHLFAYAIKDTLVELLDRKPAPYRATADLAGGYARVPAPDGLTDDDARWLRPMLDELDRRHAEPWDAGALSRLARKSRSALYRDFIAAMKVTPMEYVKLVRLREAHRLLLATDATVSQIAVRVGFSSPSHLSREFSRCFGVAPSQLRREGAYDLAV